MAGRVRGGRLLLDEPVDLPEGTEVELVPADEDRARLHEALRRSADQFRAGQGTSAKKVLAVRAIQAWWTANRPAVPDLFHAELGAALAKLGESPAAGAPYRASSGVSGMRRWKLTSEVGRSV